MWCDSDGVVLLQSHAADPAAFPALGPVGFHETKTLRLYSDTALKGSLTITIAEPLEHRNEVAREMQMGLLAPLFIVIPLSLAGIALVLRQSFRPLLRFRKRLERRGAADLSAIDPKDLPAEVQPMASALNDLLARLDGAFQAERSFAANAAHELRTPLAGAIAQAQRLRSETKDPIAAGRAAEIEQGLKRLTRLSERLMQLARAEGGKLRGGAGQDLRAVLRLVAQDVERLSGGLPIMMDLPQQPVLSDMDPDAFGILCRNLFDNALRHGDEETAVSVQLSRQGVLTVANGGPAIPQPVMAELGKRFVRGEGRGSGSGLGLAIVKTIADRVGGQMTLHSPRQDQPFGFAVVVDLSATVAQDA